MEQNNTLQLKYGNKEITLVGTAHVSRQSTQEVAAVIAQVRPDAVCVELCESRFQTITRKGQWQDTDIFKVIKEKKAFLLLANFLLAHFQKKIGNQLGVRPGEEMIQAIRSAEEINAKVHLADRDIRITLSRVWRLMGFWTKVKLGTQLLTSLVDTEDLDRESIEKMKEKDVLESVLSELGETLPALRQVLIDERDQYLAHRIRTAPGEKIVAVVGAGHVPGIQRHWLHPVDVVNLESLPPKGKLGMALKWGIPMAIVGLMILGFFVGGSKAGTDMILWWVLTNSVFAGIGAAVVLSHPLTVLSAVLTSPFAALHPMIAVGWVSGLVEAFLRKPKVKDFEDLPEDISSLKRFWKNKITRILLIVVFTNMGSVVGTFVAIPLMSKVFL
jgi:pheromone shutdown-related protein TraB